MRRILAGGLGLSLVLSVVSARAQDAPRGALLLTPTVNPTPAGALDRPAVALGRPVVLGAAAEEKTAGAVAGGTAWRPVSYSGPEAPAPIIRGQMPDAPPPPPPSGAGAPISPTPPPVSTPPYTGGVIARQEPAPAPSFWERCRELVGLDSGAFEATANHHLFESDHAFDGFISPVTNPFYFEDPRALTEARPILLYQQTPTRNPIFHGGDIEYFGVQARVAVTERWSFVLDKFGGTWMEPHDAIDGFEPHAGFSEIWLGPKFTFLRCENTGTLGAVGLTFEIPVGDRKVFQDTGSLSLVPYVSLGQTFLRSSYGTFNALGTLGYDFSVDRQRSESFFLSLHLDYDVLNLHKIYPLIELNWFHYTRNGVSEPINFEGADLFNFGAEQIAGHNDLSLALGARYKFNENLQVGAAIETPLTSQSRDLMAYRLTFDVIFRY